MSVFTHFDDMCFPQPGEELSQIEWNLRYGTPTKEQLGVAASVISAYSGLVMRKTQKERNYVCSKLRGASQKGEGMSDAEKYVREQLPEVHLAGPMRNGRPHPEGGYLLFATPLCSGPFSAGGTVIEAWASAANKLLAPAERQGSREPQ